MKKNPILRSGFVGMSMNGMRQPKVVETTHVEKMVNGPLIEVDEEYLFHGEIQDLFVKAIQGTQIGILNQFDFQEQILKAAAEAFSTRNFWDWVAFQFDEGSISDLHSLFLDETINYISGVRRKTHIQQWIRILRPDISLDTKTGSHKSLSKSLLEIKESNCVPSSLSKVFCQWLRQVDGYHDFIYSLEVIFGSRRIHSRIRTDDALRFC